MCNILLDLTSEESFPLIKQLLNTILNNLNCQYLKKILLVNKIDLQEQKKVSNYELTDYITDNISEFDNYEIILTEKINIRNFKD